MYWVFLNRKNEVTRYEDSLLPGIIPDRIKGMLTTKFAEDVDICKLCDMDRHAHPIDEETGIKYCTILFCDVVKPTWNVEDVL